MEKEIYLLLRIFRAVINSEEVGELEITQEEYQWLYRNAQKQHIVPLLYEGISLISNNENLSNELDNYIKLESIAIMTEQIGKTKSFLSIYAKLREAGITALVLKGLVCRYTYGKYSNHRLSTDEDIWIKKDEFFSCAKVLTSNGYEMQHKKVTEAMLDQIQVVSFYHEILHLHIEVHLNPMGDSGPLARKMNNVFSNSFSNYMVVNIMGQEILTLNPTEHLLFLFLHFMKHLMLYGVGIRQVMDILMFYKFYYDKINWDYIKKVLEEFSAITLFTDLIYIGNSYLGFEFPSIGVPNVPDKLLEDISESGVFGLSTEEHKNAAKFTSTVVESGSKNQIIKTIFPNRDRIKASYPILCDKPWMLPIVWIHRIVNFIIRSRKVSKGKKKLMELESIKISNQRVQLLQEYNII